MQFVDQTTPHQIAQAVRAFYETHPYPKYPILAKPLWREGYLCSSMFARALAGLPPLTAGGHTLIAGCGEILPYVIRSWEPAAQAVTAMDLSTNSLRRARLRCLRTGKSVQWIAANMETWLPAQEGRSKFSHIDAFGVLHHLSSPTGTLRALAATLVHGGTMRVMVYNSAARSWIHHVQRAFALLKLDPTVPAHVTSAMGILRSIGERSIHLKSRLSAMGPTMLGNEARFCDTFLHPREARISLHRWLDEARAMGLRLVGILDRYGEGDHLPNPLWNPPEATHLERLAAQRVWEGNWELYFAKNDGTSQPSSAGAPRALRWPAWLDFDLAPRAWTAWNETRTLTLPHRRKLWRAFRERLISDVNLPQVQATVRSVLDEMPLAEARRLARIGAILPDMVEGDLRSKLNEPLDEYAPQPPEGAGSAQSSLLSIADILALIVAGQSPASTQAARQSKLTHQAAQRLRAATSI